MTDSPNDPNADRTESPADDAAPSIEQDAAALKGLLDRARTVAGRYLSEQGAPAEADTDGEPHRPIAELRRYCEALEAEIQDLQTRLQQDTVVLDDAARLRRSNDELRRELADREQAVLTLQNAERKLREQIQAADQQVEDLRQEAERLQSAVAGAQHDAERLRRELGAARAEAAEQERLVAEARERQRQLQNEVQRLQERNEQDSAIFDHVSRLRQENHEWRQKARQAERDLALLEETAGELREALDRTTRERDLLEEQKTEAETRRDALERERDALRRMFGETEESLARLRDRYTRELQERDSRINELRDARRVLQEEIAQLHARRQEDNVRLEGLAASRQEIRSLREQLDRLRTEHAETQEREQTLQDEVARHEGARTAQAERIQMLEQRARELEAELDGARKRLEEAALELVHLHARRTADAGPALLDHTQGPDAD
ncbi:MAG: hypothetical protein ACOCX4_06840 [Planctomycetota bacterium]